MDERQKPEGDLPDPLTPAEIAALERVGLTTVIGWCRSGKLPASKVGGLWRVRRADYLAFKKPNARRAKTAPKPTGKVPGRSRQAISDRVLDAAGI